MLGAIIGDVAGSRFEWNIKVKDFDLLGVAGKCRMTDDSYMSLAVAKAVLEYNGDLDKLSKLAIKYMQEIGRKYPYAGYGGSFKQWCNLKIHSRITVMETALQCASVLAVSRLIVLKKPYTWQMR